MPELKVVRADYIVRQAAAHDFQDLAASFCVSHANGIVFYYLLHRFYNARMSLLENIGDSDKKEMYRDINDLREEIVKILHEFGAADKGKVQNFSIDKNLSDHASQRAYSRKQSDPSPVKGEGSALPERKPESEPEESPSTSKPPSPKNKDVGFRGQNQNIPMKQLSREWAKLLCKRLTHISERFKAPLASNGYDDFYGLHKIRSITAPTKRRYNGNSGNQAGNLDHDGNSSRGDSLHLYNTDTLFEGIGKLKVIADRLHREAQASVFRSSEMFRQVGSKNYYEPEMHELLEYGCSMIPKCLKSLTPLEVLEEFHDLHPEHAQIGVDDMLDDSHYKTQYQEGLKILQEGKVELSRKYCRRGVPAELRTSIWAVALGIEIDPISTAKKKWLASLHKKRRMSKMLIERLIEEDINLVLDNDHYFPFEDILKSTLFAFFLDDKVNGMCKGEESSRPKLYGFGESGSNHGLYPPCGIIPFSGMSWYAAPLTFLFGFQILTKVDSRQIMETQERYRPLSASSVRGKSSQSARERKRNESLLLKSQEKQKRELSNNAKQVEEHARCYYTFRALYCRHFCRLHTGPYDTSSGISPSLLGLCKLFEDLMEQTQPEVNYHLYGIIGIAPLALAFPWIVHGFAQVLVPEQVLLLWDRVIGFDSLIPVVLLAVSVFHFRSKELLESQTLDEVNLFLDFREMKVIPMLQQFMKHLEDTNKWFC